MNVLNRIATVIVLTTVPFFTHAQKSEHLCEAGIASIGMVAGSTFTSALAYAAFGKLFFRSPVEMSIGGYARSSLPYAQRPCVSVAGLNPFKGVYHFQHPTIAPSFMRIKMAAMHAAGPLAGIGFNAAVLNVIDSDESLSGKFVAAAAYINMARHVISQVPAKKRMSADLLLRGLSKR